MKKLIISCILLFFTGCGPTHQEVQKRVDTHELKRAYSEASQKFQDGKFSDAKVALEKALAFAQQRGLALNQLRINRDLGRIWEIWGQYDKALEIYSDAIRSTHEPRLQLGVKLLQSAVYRKMDNITKSEEIARQVEVQAKNIRGCPR